MKLMSGVNHYNLFLFEQSNAKNFFHPIFLYSYDNLETALQEMKIKSNDIYLPVIPDNVNFEVIDEKMLLLWLNSRTN